uniref:Uncharacterized protein n=1 Tax=Oryza glumipatula TaxID=40148 RepID=A0A0D9YWQ4_9ORYZ
MTALQPVVLIHPPEQHPPNPRIHPQSNRYVLFPLSLSLSVLLPSQARPSSSIRFDAPLRHSPPPVRRPPLLLPLRALLSEPEREVEMKMVGESGGGSGDDLLSIPLFRVGPAKEQAVVGAGAAAANTTATRAVAGGGGGLTEATPSPSFFWACLIYLDLGLWA